MITRRTLLGSAVFTAASAKRILGANERVRVALVGCGGRGRYVAKLMREAPNVSFDAVSDVQAGLMAQAREWAGPQAQEQKDFRRVLERKDIDAVLVATPDHWHASAAILACQAGKDVYVEKPLAHNIREGRMIVDAAKKSGRIVQVGTQQRSALHFPEVAKIIQSGQLGEVRFVRVWNFVNLAPNGIGRAADGTAPADLDWDMYLGPAPMRPYNPLRAGATFRWFWDYAGGTITDFGTHRFDTVHQIMGQDMPLTANAVGHRYVLKDSGEMPDTLQVTYEYPGFVMSYEMSNLSAHGLGGRSSGMKYYNSRGAVDRPHGEAYYGTNGAIFADRIGYEIYPDPVEQTVVGGAINPLTGTTSGGAPPVSGKIRIERRERNVTDATGLHAQHFIECVRSRKTPVATPITGHRATIISHLGNISYKTGEKLHWDAEKEECNGSKAANELLGREPRKQWKLV